MRWRRRHDDPGVERKADVSEATQARRQAEKALVAAHESLAKTKSETDMFRIMGQTLSALRERNHITADLKATISRGYR